MIEKGPMVKKRILLVEDEADLVMTMRFRLEDAGYEVVVAVDGQEGLDRAKDGKPDLILLDLMLPKMNGYKVFSALKADARYSKIPIIMFTALAQEADKKLGEKMGADAYITKPFDADTLLAKIKELIK